MLVLLHDMMYYGQVWKLTLHSSWSSQQAHSQVPRLYIYWHTHTFIYIHTHTYTHTHTHTHKWTSTRVSMSTYLYMRSPAHTTPSQNSSSIFLFIFFLFCRYLYVLVCLFRLLVWMITMMTMILILTAMLLSSTVKALLDQLWEILLMCLKQEWWPQKVRTHTCPALLCTQLSLFFLFYHLFFQASAIFWIFFITSISYTSHLPLKMIM